MTTPENDFYLKVAHALSGCQLVEEHLKLYITEALELVKKCVGDKIAFKMIGEDYADSSLERLIEIFKKLSDNETLVTELRQFKDERNFLSHKGITHCLDYDDELDYGAMSEFQNRLAAIPLEAQRLRLALHDEANKFRGHLWFGFDNDSNEG
ncbi:hypothetical protein AYO43_09625 [Nitrospira sp. SCGC AG-212-E16]|nr:hypothetical protein AYO43_09625 [Nitrospira sp. SCGC AG-212-E16]